MTRKNIKAEYAILTAFTLAQLVILAIYGYTPYPDSNDFLMLARQSIGQGDPYPTPRQLQEGFVWNVGTINAAGLSLWLTDSINPLLVIYSLFKGATALCLFLTAKQLMGRRTALTALWLYVLYPANYGEATSVLSELPFIGFAMAGVALAVHRKPLAAGVLLAAGNWFRPMGIVFLLAVAVWQVAAKSGWRPVARTLAGYALAVAVLGGMSYACNRRFIYQAKTGWMALMQYSWEHDPDHAEDARLFPHGDPTFIPDTIGYVEKDRIWRSRFFLWLSRNKGEYLRQMPEKLARTYLSDNTTFCAFLPGKEKRTYLYEELSLPRLRQDFPHLTAVQTLTLSNLGYYYLLCLLFAAGSFVMLRRREVAKAALPLAVFTLGTLVLLLAGHGESRFHAPFMPFFILAAAYFLQRKAPARVR